MKKEMKGVFWVANGQDLKDFCSWQKLNLYHCRGMTSRCSFTQKGQTATSPCDIKADFQHHNILRFYSSSRIVLLSTNSKTGCKGCFIGLNYQLNCQWQQKSLVRRAFSWRFLSLAKIFKYLMLSQTQLLHLLRNQKADKMYRF